MSCLYVLLICLAYMSFLYALLIYHQVMFHDSGLRVAKVPREVLLGFRV